MVQITKTDFIDFLYTAQKEAMSTSIITSVWAETGEIPLTLTGLLLTITGLFLFDSQWVLSKLPHAWAQTPPASESMTISNQSSKTSCTHKQFLDSLNHLNQYTLTFDWQVNALKKATSTLLAHHSILKCENECLFKTNLNKVCWQKKKLQKRDKANYSIGFERVLTSALTYTAKQKDSKELLHLAAKTEATAV